MALENLYFKHNFNAHNDPKLAKILKEMKYEGVGMFWTITEIFYTNGGYIMPEDIEVICWDNHMEFDKLMQLFKLAEVKKNIKGYYMESILKRIDKREEYCKKQKENAKKRWDNKKNEVEVDEDTGEIKNLPVMSGLTPKQLEERKEQVRKELDKIKYKK